MKIARTEQLSRLVRSVAVNPAQLARATVRLEAPAPARRRQVILGKRVKPPHLSTMPVSRPMFYRRGHVAVGPVERIVGHRFPAGSAGREVRSSRELLVVHDSLRLAEALCGRTPPLIQLAEIQTVDMSALKLTSRSDSSSAPAPGASPPVGERRTDRRVAKAVWILELPGRSGTIHLMHHCPGLACYATT
jgi:hypothetical protein